MLYAPARLKMIGYTAAAAVLIGAVPTAAGARARTVHKYKVRTARTYAYRGTPTYGSRLAPTYKARTAQSNTVVLNAGTVIPVKLDTQLSSDQSREGDTFTATVDNSRTAYRSIMRGATLDGVVREATPTDGTNPGLLDLSFTRLHLADGRNIALAGVPTSLDSKYVAQRPNGVLVAHNTRKDDRLKYAGIGAGAVALIKVLSGDKVKLTDILIGGGLGYAAGTILDKKNNEKVHDVTLEPGTQIGVLLHNPVRYARVAPRPVAHPY